MTAPQADPPPPAPALSGKALASVLLAGAGLLALGLLGGLLAAAAAAVSGREALAWALLAGAAVFILWLVFGFLAAGAALLGHLALHDLRSRPVRGRALAVLGTALGYFSMALFPLLAAAVVLLLPGWQDWSGGRDGPPGAGSREKAERLFLAAETYARANRGRYPSAWSELAGRYVLAGELADLLASPHPGGAEEAFELVPHERPVLDAVAGSVIVIQEVAPPNVPEIVVVLADGEVRRFHNPDFEEP